MLKQKPWILPPSSSSPSKAKVATIISVRSSCKLLRRLADENDVLLIFDEVQSGMGITGKRWACGTLWRSADLISFGKKSQVCGVMAGTRLDEVSDNCFRLPSRISSTWGGNFTDYVRSTHYLRIYEQEKLVENADVAGKAFLVCLRELARKIRWSPPRAAKG